MRVQAQVFGPELPAGGAALPVRLAAGRLTLTLPDGRVHGVPLACLVLRRGGFNELTWHLQWQEPDGTWSVSIDDAVQQRALLAAPPAGLEAQLAALGRAGRRQTLGRGFGWSLLAGWLLVPLLAIALLVWQAEAITGWIAARVPIAREVQLGDLVFARERPRLTLIENTAANRAVEMIGARLTADSRYRYRWFVARDASVNAYAIPGGIVVVHSGLIAVADNAEELAGVLAHEVQHVELRHSLKGMAQQLGITAALAIAVGDSGSAAQLAARLSQLRFSRDQERAADAAALAALRGAGIDPRGLVAIFGKLERDAEANPPPFLSTHPATAERIAVIEQAIDAAPQTAVTPLAIDWSTVRESLARPEK